jgi:hypothetical protein
MIFLQEDPATAAFSSKKNFLYTFYLGPKWVEVSCSLSPNIHGQKSGRLEIGSLKGKHVDGPSLRKSDPQPLVRVCKDMCEINPCLESLKSQTNVMSL